MAKEPYRPSNGTEGSQFEETFCSRCQKEETWRKHQRNPCEIIMCAFAYDIGDEKYPKEWVWNQEEPSSARCTAFVDIQKYKKEKWKTFLPKTTQFKLFGGN